MHLQAQERHKLPIKPQRLEERPGTESPSWPQRAPTLLHLLSPSSLQETDSDATTQVSHWISTPPSYSAPTPNHIQPPSAFSTSVGNTHQSLYQTVRCRPCCPIAAEASRCSEAVPPLTRTLSLGLEQASWQAVLDVYIFRISC